MKTAERKARHSEVAMRIVIVGGGTVGSAICAQLSAEGHDITLIDTALAPLSENSNVCDVFGIVGNGAEVSVLRKASADKADLLIAVTPEDEINILCCAVSRKLGTKHTVARVRNPEYSELMQLMKNEMNLSMTINPELAAAKEIFRMLRYPSAAKVEPFFRGKVDLVEFVVGVDSPICGKSLFDLRTFLKAKFLVCCVLRGDEVYIPSGDFVLQANDIIGVTAPDGELTRLFKATGTFRQPVRDVLIVGGGRVTYYLQTLLQRSKIKTVVIEKDKELCYELTEQFDITVVCEDGTKQEVLLEEGIEQADAFLTLSDVDEQNAIMSMYARSKQVPKVITMINQLSYVDFFKGMGLESIVSPKSATANDILHYVRSMSDDDDSEIESLHKIMGGRAEALEFIVKQDIEDITDIPLKELKPRSGVLIACLIHNNKVIIPSGNDCISKGDTVIVVTSDGKLKNIKDIIK